MYPINLKKYSLLYLNTEKNFVSTKPGNVLWDTFSGTVWKNLPTSDVLSILFIRWVDSHQCTDHAGRLRYKSVVWSSARLLISLSLWELVTSFEIVGHQWVGLGYFFGHSYHTASFEYMADLWLTQQLSIDQFNNGGLYKYSWPLWLCMMVENMILNTKWFPIQISQSTFNKLLSFFGSQKHL